MGVWMKLEGGVWKEVVWKEVVWKEVVWKEVVLGEVVWMADLEMRP